MVSDEVKQDRRESWRKREIPRYFSFYYSPFALCPRFHHPRPALVDDEGGTLRPPSLPLLLFLDCFWKDLCKVFPLWKEVCENAWTLLSLAVVWELLASEYGLLATLLDTFTVIFLHTLFFNWLYITGFNPKNWIRHQNYINVEWRIHCRFTSWIYPLFFFSFRSSWECDKQWKSKLC